MHGVQEGNQDRSWGLSIQRWLAVSLKTLSTLIKATSLVTNGTIKWQSQGWVNVVHSLRSNSINKTRVPMCKSPFWANYEKAYIFSCHLVSHRPSNWEFSVFREMESYCLGVWQPKKCSWLLNTGTEIQRGVKDDFMVWDLENIHSFITLGKMGLTRESRHSFRHMETKVTLTSPAEMSR